MSSVPLQTFIKKISGFVDVISPRLGGKVVGFSDEWFAEASNLIKPSNPIREIGKFTPKGAWYDGWETRRHNPEEADWVIFQLGVKSANIIGVEVDTAFFNGNHAPAISVEGAYLNNSEDDFDPEQITWKPVINYIECGPSQRHFFLLENITRDAFSHLRLRMYPDGGIARFRAYGSPVPVFPDDRSVEIDLASVSNGGITVSWSDKRFSSPDNLLLPGRGHDMSDGWETTRSRDAGHVDWVILKLGSPGYIDRVIVDTAYFLGNYPTAITVEGINYEQREESIDPNDSQWKQIVSESATGPGKEHEFTRNDKDNLLLTSENQVFTHVKLTIIPDGGVKRLRIFGRRI